jgi:ketosteroid isomerase-like protein
MRYSHLAAVCVLAALSIATPAAAQMSNIQISSAQGPTSQGMDHQPKTAREAADLAAIRAVGQTWKRLYTEGRFSEIPNLYTQDTMVMPRGRPVIVGRDQMRRSIGGLAAGRKVNIDVTEKEAFVAGRYGWFVSEFKVTYTPAVANAPVVSEHGRSLILYRKDSDGQWRIHRDMDSPAPHADLTEARAALLLPPVGPAPALWDPRSRTEVTQCDRLTASRYDRTRLAPPVARDAMDVPAAIAQCEADLARFPDDPRLNFQLGRIYGYAGDRTKTLAARRAAARAGNHNAIFLLAYLDWTAAKDETARCTAARDMKLAADRGNYSAQLTYASFFLEDKFKACPEVATRGEVSGYIAAARPAVDGFFETRLADHLAAQMASQ